MKRRQEVDVIVLGAVRCTFRPFRRNLLLTTKDDGFLGPIVFGHCQLATEIKIELAVLLPGGFLFGGLCVVPHVDLVVIGYLEFWIRDCSVVFFLKRSRCAEWFPIAK